MDYSVGMNRGLENNAFKSGTQYSFLRTVLHHQLFEDSVTSSAI